MRTVKSSTSREVAARPHTGVEVPQEGLFADIRALDAKTTILDRIARSQADVAVIGAGYVGLAVASEAAAVGFNVSCLDIDAERIRSLNNGRSYVEDVSSETIEELRKAGRLVASTEFDLLDRCDIAVIAVPTPLTPSKEPDLSAVESAAEEVRRYLRPGSLVVLESTTYPGTTTEVLQPLLESTGLKAGRDFWLAYSPERIDPGNKRYSLRTTPKIVGGVDPQSTEVAAAFYGKLVDRVVPVSCATTAEMIKIYENVFRNVNIAFANEAAQLCHRMGIDAWEVIDGAATKPFGFMPFYPGPGLGGHCIPVDPHYLSWKARQYDFQVKFIELAADINANMPYYVVSRVMMALNERQKALMGSTVLILGAAYKPDVADTRESPVYKIMPLLQKAGARVLYNDPYVAELTVKDCRPQRMESRALSDSLLSTADCVLMLTCHSCFDCESILRASQVIVDTRNAFRSVNGHPGKVVRL
jgi:UDP-N-acetyl-D-glucosamine dehydrogenase